MAFPDGWTKRLTVTASPTVVGTGGVTDFTTLVSAAALYALLSSLREDGGDLVCTLNADGTGRLAIDVLPGWSSSDGTGFVRVGPLSLSSVSTNTLYFWGGNPSATQPAAGAAHGQHAAYDSGWAAYYPLDGDGDDRTANGRHLYAYSGTPDFGSQLVGGGVELDIGDALQVDDGIFGGVPPVMVLAWIKHSSDGAEVEDWAFYKTLTTGAGFFLRRRAADNYRLIHLGGGTSHYVTKTPSSATTNWHHIAAWYDAGNIYLDLDASGSAVSGAADTEGAVVAFRLNGGGGSQKDDVQVHLAVRSAAWIETEYRQTSAPGTFWQAGTLDTIGGSSGGARRRRLIICGRVR